MVLQSNTIYQHLLAEKEAIEAKSKTDSPEKPRFSRLGASESELQRLQTVYQEIRDRNLIHADVTAREILKGLGFSDEMINQPTHLLSGGWRMR